MGSQGVIEGSRGERGREKGVGERVGGDERGREQKKRLKKNGWISKGSWEDLKGGLEECISKEGKGEGMNKTKEERGCGEAEKKEFIKELKRTLK